MNKDFTFVTLDDDNTLPEDAVVIDMDDENLSSDVVYIDETPEHSDFITVIDDSDISGFDIDDSVIAEIDFDDSSMTDFDTDLTIIV